MGLLTVARARQAQLTALRNVPAAGPGICAICKTFVGPGFRECFACRAEQPNHLDVVVPISYSEHGGRLHAMLRTYKGPPSLAQRHAALRLNAILAQFLAHHERCIAVAAGVAAFDVVATVPSSSLARELEGALRGVVARCAPVAGRLRRALLPTGLAPPSRAYDERRYVATATLLGRSLLLIDDTWARGGHAQSAAHALRRAGAERIALVVVGRHINPDWRVGDATCGQLLQALPGPFSWDTCSLHRQ